MVSEGYFWSWGTEIWEVVPWMMCEVVPLSEVPNDEFRVLGVLAHPRWVVYVGSIPSGILHCQVPKYV